jgi:hypothetical protein
MKLIETTSKERYDRTRLALEQAAHLLGIGECSGWGDCQVAFAVLYRLARAA